MPKLLYIERALVMVVCGCQLGVKTVLTCLDPTSAPVYRHV